MTVHDPLDAALGSWLEREAQVSIPIAARDQVLGGIADRRPRPERVAGFGSRWVGDRSSALSAIGVEVQLPRVRPLSVLLVLLLTLVLVGAALLIGSRQPEIRLDARQDLGRLVYQLDDEVFIADSDGRNPLRVGPIASSTGEGEAYLSAVPSTWAPDGRHFHFEVEIGNQRVVYIADAAGRVVASSVDLPETEFPGAWSPDSTLLQVWSPRGVSLLGVDGVMQEPISMPEGYDRVGDGFALFAPDGQSLWVWVMRPQALPCNLPVPGAVKSYPGDCLSPEAWALPIDGSPPLRVAADLPYLPFDVDFSPDGTAMAYSGGSPVGPGIEPDNLIHVAERDGSDPRTIIAGETDRGDQIYSLNPTWSPGSDRLAYLWPTGDRQVVIPAERNNDPKDRQDVLPDPYAALGPFELRVVDIATNVVTTVATLDREPTISWSAAGDALLYTQPYAGKTSLWSVDAKGGPPTLLLDGIPDGAWQPIARH